MQWLCYWKLSQARSAVGNYLKLKSNILRLLFSFIDFLAVADAEHDNVVALYVEDHTIIADAKTVAAEFRVSQPFSVLERIVFEAKEGRADAVLDTRVKSVNVSSVVSHK